MYNLVIYSKVDCVEQDFPYVTKLISEELNERVDLFYQHLLDLTFVCLKAGHSVKEPNVILKMREQDYQLLIADFLEKNQIRSIEDYVIVFANGMSSKIVLWKK